MPVFNLPGWGFGHVRAGGSASGSPETRAWLPVVFGRLRRARRAPAGRPGRLEPGGAGTSQEPFRFRLAGDRLVHAARSWRPAGRVRPRPAPCAAARPLALPRPARPSSAPGPRPPAPRPRSSWTGRSLAVPERVRAYSARAATTRRSSCFAGRQAASPSSSGTGRGLRFLCLAAPAAGDHHSPAHQGDPR